MFRTAYQRGFLTVFYSCGSKPLELWEAHMENGHISRLLDPDLKSMVLDIRGNNVSTAYITCPPNNRILGITMPFMIMVVKNLKKYFTFEVTILDDTGARRRFRVSNFQSTTQILPMSTAMPIGLADGWNQIQFNLSEFTRRAYNKAFVEVQKIKVNANIRLRRIYFAERLTPEEDLPAEYRIFLPLPSKVGKGKRAEGEGSKTTVIKAPSKIGQAPLKSASKASIVDLPQAAPPVGTVVEQPPEVAAAEEPPATEEPPAAGEPPAVQAQEPVPDAMEATAAESEAAEAVETPEGATTEGESEAATEAPIDAQTEDGAPPDTPAEAEAEAAPPE